MAVQRVEDPLGLARRYLDGGQPQRALVSLDGAPDLADDPEFWELRAAALYWLDRYDESADAAEHGLRRDPENADLLETLAIAELERGRDKQALAAIDAALELYPDIAELHAQRALILARRKRKSFRVESFKKAREAVDEALRLDPDSDGALRVRAQIAALSGDRRAPQYAAELLEREPDDEDVHAITGAALANTGDSAALRHFEEAARLNPSNPAFAWAGRYARELRRPFFAPVLFLERITRGHVRIGWFVIAYTSIRFGPSWLTVFVFAFWAYMWAVHIYLRRRFGKEPG